VIVIRILCIQREIHGHTNNLIAANELKVMLKINESHSHE